MKVLKRKSFYFLVVSAILCLVLAFVPFTTKSAFAEAPDIASGFTVKGAYIQMELGTENNPDSGKFSLTFVAELTEEAYNTAAAQGELKVGLLVGKKSMVSNVVGDGSTYAAAISYGFKPLSNVGSANSGSQQVISFVDGVAEIQAGIVFDEDKLPEGKLQAAGKLPLVAIPYVTYVNELDNAEDDVSYIYVDSNAAKSNRWDVERSAAPIILESYIRSSHFDYEKYADDENKPVVVTKDMVKKFVVDVDDPTMYEEVEGEFYYDTKYKDIQMADPVTNYLNHKNVLADKGIFTNNFVWNTHKAYVGGKYYPGGNYSTWATDNSTGGGLGNLDLSGLTCSDKYTYGFTVFENATGKVKAYAVKAATMIIKSYNMGGTNTYESIVGPYNGMSSFDNLFGNSVPSRTDRNLQQRIDGYYVLGNDITWTTMTRNINAGAIARGSSAGYAGVNPLINDGTKGFVGTFDGRGFGFYDATRPYTRQANGGLTGMFETGTGLFTWINGGTVKNLSFINITLTNVPRNGSILAHAITNNSVIENVYIRPLVNSYVYTTFGPQSISWEQGYLLATKTYDSTFRNVIVESDFFDESEVDVSAGINHFELFNNLECSGNTYENVFSLGGTPVSYEANKSNGTATLYVNELPALDEAGTLVTAGEAYALAEYPLLLEAYGDLAANLANHCRGAYHDSYADLTGSDMTVKFVANEKGIKQLAGYRDLAAYINAEGNEEVKAALVNSGFYNVAESGFVTPKFIPKTKAAVNHMAAGYTYSNRVDDCIIISFTAPASATTPIHDGTHNPPSIMIMADADGKFYADFTTSEIAGIQGYVYKVFDYTDAWATNSDILISGPECTTATAWEIPAVKDTLYTRR